MIIITLGCQIIPLQYCGILTPDTSHGYSQLITVMFAAPAASHTLFHSQTDSPIMADFADHIAAPVRGTSTTSSRFSAQEGGRRVGGGSVGIFSTEFISDILQCD